MRRRDLLQVLGSAAVVPFLAPLSPEGRLALARAVHARLPQATLRALNPAQHAVVAELSELIIPETDTPGARQVRVPEFVDLVLAEWHTPEERTRFLAGLDALDARCRERFGAGVADAAPERRAELAAGLDGVRGEPGSPEAAWSRLKQLTVTGYFTSEPVMKDVLRTTILPGRYDGCVPVVRRAP